MEKSKGTFWPTQYVYFFFLSYLNALDKDYRSIEQKCLEWKSLPCFWSYRESILFLTIRYSASYTYFHRCSLLIKSSSIFSLLRIFINNGLNCVKLFFAYIYCVDHMCFGEGNGNPLQCSCLENPRDRGAWWAAVYGVTQSQTRLKWLSSSSICVYSYFILLKRWITLIHIGILNLAFLIMIYYDILSFYMYCYVWLNDILLILRIFASMLMRDIL